MDQPCPPHWTFAARAAYFGESMCPFCDHRNPAGAKFCNDCAWPLDLKPCHQCNAVNNQTASNCYQCGAACAASSSTSKATPEAPSADVAPSRATAGDVAVTALATQALGATGTMRNRGRLSRPVRFLFAAVAMILIAGAYATRHIDTVTPDSTEVAMEAGGAGEQNVPQATAAVSLSAGPDVVEPKMVEPEATAALAPPVPGDDADIPIPASEEPRPVAVPATLRTNEQQRPMPERGTPTRAAPRSTRSAAAAPIGVQVTAIRKMQRPDRWQAMQTSLARCSGDLFERIVCDQRVRLRFCDGYWGKAPQCTSGVVNEHGQ